MDFSRHIASALLLPFGITFFAFLVLWSGAAFLANGVLQGLRLLAGRG